MISFSPIFYQSSEWTLWCHAYKITHMNGLMFLSLFRQPPMEWFQPQMMKKSAPSWTSFFHWKPATFAVMWVLYFKFFHCHFLWNSTTLSTPVWSKDAHLYRGIQCMAAWPCSQWDWKHYYFPAGNTELSVQPASLSWPRLATLWEHGQESASVSQWHQKTTAMPKTVSGMSGGRRGGGVAALWL